MNQLTAHREEYTRNQADLYLAFELGNKGWKLGFRLGLVRGLGKGRFQREILLV
ncbi:MAG: hypothetical protein GTO13_02350 [Proteobacteria bacterium]|nr:hypothetical protein [Pseudomonadota bacterium]